MRVAITFTLLLLFISTACQAQNVDSQRNTIQAVIAQQRKYDDKSGFDMRFYKISLDINLERHIKGEVLCEFMSTKPNLDIIEFNLSDKFKVNRVLGASQDFERHGEKVIIRLKNKLNIGEIAWLTIFYETNENLTSSKGQNLDMLTKEFTVNPKTIFENTQGWFPAKDGWMDKVDSLHINLTIPDLMIDDVPIVAVANGRLADIVLLSHKRLFKWEHQYPIATSHIGFAVSNYKTIEQSVDLNGERIKIVHYVFPDQYFKYLEQFSELPEMVKFFSDKLLKYPFSKDNLGVLQIGENQFSKGQTNIEVLQSADNLSAHLAYGLMKSWFGDYISAGSTQDKWLFEGLSLYAIALWNEHKLGAKGYESTIKTFENHGEGVLYGHNTSILNYKSAYIFHMLRGVLGNQVFFDVLKSFAYNDKHRYGFATTSDFIEECERGSGKQLSYFFDQWLYEELYPIYTYHFWKTEDKKIKVQIVQPQKNTENTIFSMPIDLKFSLNGKDTIITVFNDKQSQDLEFYFGSNKLTDVEFDPNNKILKEVILKEHRLSSKEPVRDVKIEAEGNFNRYVTISMRAHTKQWAIIELRTFDGKRVYYQELLADDLFNETIEFPLSIPKGNYQIFISTNSSVFSRNWELKN
jgi:aminopeptidase N